MPSTPPNWSPESPAASDADVVRSVLLGKTSDFAVLVDRHHARCLRVAIHMLNDQDLAEDAVQDAFVRAYRHLGSYRERDRFGAWLLRIVVNQCRTHATRESRFVRFGAEPSVVTDARHPESSANSATHIVQDTVQSIEVDHARKTELAFALAQLAPEQREAVVLRFAEEMTYEEISALTGVGVSALKMRVKRGCTRLRTLLSDFLHV